MTDLHHQDRAGRVAHRYTPAPTLAGSSSQDPPLTAGALTALQAALATEQAAEWAYGLVAAHVSEEQSTEVAAMVASHRSTRNVAVDLLAGSGATPVTPSAAYETPFTIDDSTSALKLALTIESDCAAAWRAVIGHTADATVRTTALSALTQASLHLVTWRTAAGDDPVTTPFPGAPDHD